MVINKNKYEIKDKIKRCILPNQKSIKKQQINKIK